MIFCKNPDATIPILEIYDVIGEAADDFGVVTGISGKEFADYLKFIEGQAGKTGIDIYINSVGGSIIEGMTIMAAIKSCKLPVNTICVGVAVSMAGVILQAGKTRKMVKEGLMMIHPPSGGDAKELDALKRALIQYLTPRTDMTEDEMEAMMDETSWLDANQCLEMKLIDEIVDITSVANAPEVKKIENKSKRLLRVVNELKINKQTEPQNNNTMDLSKIKNQLGLNADATELQFNEALKNLQNSDKKAYKAIEKALKDLRKTMNKKDNDDDDEDTVTSLANEVADMKKNYKKMEDTVADLDAKLKAKNTENEELKAQVADLSNAGSKKEAEDAINAAIEAGKIKAEVKDTFVNMYLADKDQTVALLDGIVVNKVGARMPVQSTKTPVAKTKVDGKNVMSEVADSNVNFINAFRKSKTAEIDKKLKGTK